MPQCKAILKNGKRCGNFTKYGDIYCFQHIHLYQDKMKRDAIRKAIAYKNDEHDKYRSSDTYPKSIRKYTNNGKRIDKSIDEDGELLDEEDKPDEEIETPLHPEVKPDEDVSFCPFCGHSITEITKTCPCCGADIKKEIKEREKPKKKSISKKSSKKSSMVKDTYVFDKEVCIKKTKPKHDWTKFNENCKACKDWWNENKAKLVFIALFIFVIGMNIRVGMVWDQRNTQIKNACEPYYHGTRLSVDQIYNGLNQTFTNLQALQWQDNDTWLPDGIDKTGLMNQIENTLKFIQYFYHQNASGDESNYFNRMLTDQLNTIDKTINNDYYEGSSLFHDWFLLIVIDIGVLIVGGLLITGIFG